MKIILIVLAILSLASCNFSVDHKNSLKSSIEETAVDANYNPEKRLSDLGIELKIPETPVANYVHAVRSGNLIFLAGKGPKMDNGKNVIGKLGAELSVEQGYEAARWAAINQLSVLKSELGNLNKVSRIVKVKGMVNAVHDFTDQSKVINGYSDLMVEVFGEKGKHARAAVGMASLPGNMAVEVEMIVEVYE